MRSRFQGRLGVKLLLGLALFAFAWFNFSNKFRGLSALGRAIDMQNVEIARLNATIERIQTLKSMQVDLRLKLFDDQTPIVSAASAGFPAGVLSGEVLAAARRANVEFASMDPVPAGMALRFWGRYSDVARFLTVAESAFPRIENFALEKSKNGGVLLTLTVPAGPA